MSDKSFETQMKNIAAQDNALRLHEQKLARQAELKSRIIKVVVTLIFLGALAAGWYYREDLQKVATEKLQPAKATINDGTGAALKGIQEQAAKRDDVLDSLSVTATPVTNKAKAK